MAKKSTPTADPSSPSKLFIVPLCNQGSVGKTLFFTQLVYFYRHHHLNPVVAISDPDAKKPSLTAFYPESQLLDPKEDRQSLDLFFRSIADADIALMDGCANLVAEELNFWFDEVYFHQNARAIGAAVTYILFVDGNHDYIRQIPSFLQNSPEDVRLVCVVNHHKQARGILSPIEAWQSSQARALFLAKGGVEIHMDKLHDSLVKLTDKDKLPVGEYAPSLDPDNPADNPRRIFTLDRSRFLRFIGPLYEQLEQVAPALFPPAMLSESSPQVAAK